MLLIMALFLLPNGVWVPLHFHSVRRACESVRDYQSAGLFVEVSRGDKRSWQEVVCRKDREEWVLIPAPPLIVPQDSKKSGRE